VLVGGHAEAGIVPVEGVLVVPPDGELVEVDNAAISAQVTSAGNAWRTPLRRRRRSAGHRPR